VTHASHTCVIRPAWLHRATRGNAPSLAVPRWFDLVSMFVNQAGSVGRMVTHPDPAVVSARATAVPACR
jgi:hypothetical protein